MFLFQNSGDTVVGIGSLAHSSDECNDAFLSGKFIINHYEIKFHFKGVILLIICYQTEACFITREENEWYQDVNHQLLNTSSTVTTWDSTNQRLCM